LRRRPPSERFIDRFELETDWELGGTQWFHASLPSEHQAVCAVFVTPPAFHLFGDTIEILAGAATPNCSARTSSERPTRTVFRKRVKVLARRTRQTADGASADEDLIDVFSSDFSVIG